MPKFEAHLTFDQAHAQIVEHAATLSGWVYSVIAGCPLLGQGTYCYLTAYDPDAQQLLARLNNVAAYCRDRQAPPLREKIERIVYDTRTTVDELASGPLDLVQHLHRQRAFSEKTFGPGARTSGVVDHIRKELQEVLAKPDDLSEWIDVIILGCDGAWRAGHAPETIVAALVAKQTRNEGRVWPDWRTSDPNKAIEHDRRGDL